MNRRIIASVIAFPLLATMPAQGQTNKAIHRGQAVTEKKEDTAKKKTTPPKTEANPFEKWYFSNPYSEGLAVVQVKGSFLRGYVNEEGKLVLPCKWNSAEDFSEGLARVSENHTEYGYIDKTGTLVIPCQWTYATSFSEGLACVKDANNKYGFIDKTGTIVIPCQWNYASTFSEGLAWVEDENERYGFIDKTGTVVIPCQWRDARKFSEGLAWVVKNVTEYAKGVINTKGGFIDKNGTLVVPCIYSNGSLTDSYFKDGLAGVNDDKHRWGYIDKTGKSVVPCQWYKGYNFNEGLACVENDDHLFGYINVAGEEVVPCKWKWARRYYIDGETKVMDEAGKYWVIDKAGNILRQTIREAPTGKSWAWLIPWENKLLKK